MTDRLPPLIFIPGMQCTETMFEEVRHQINLQLTDARLQSWRISASNLSDAVANLLSTVEEPPILIGHSLGGTVAMAAARLFPDRVAGLALICANPRPPRPEQRTSWQAALSKVQDDQPIMIERLIPELLGHTGRRPTRQDLEKASVCRTMASDIGHGGLIAQLHVQLDRIDERPALSCFDRPTLAIAAEDDRLVATEAVAEISSSAGDGQFRILPGSSHMAPLTMPEPIASLLGGWLRQNFPAFSAL